MSGIEPEVVVTTQKTKAGGSSGDRIISGDGNDDGVKGRSYIIACVVNIVLIIIWHFAVQNLSDYYWAFDEWGGIRCMAL